MTDDTAKEKTAEAQKNKPQRNAIFDLVRIIAMLFIVTHHLSINNIGLTEIQDALNPSRTAQYVSVSFLDCFTIIGVNVFFLISGYFGVKLKFGKIFSLIIKVYFYWIFFALIGYATGLISFNSIGNAAIYMLSAIAKYWFVLAYIAVFLLSPFLNTFAEKLKRKWIKYFVFSTFLFCCGIGFVADYIYPVLGTNSGYSPVWAAVVYVYGRLIKIYGNELRNSKLFWTIWYVVLSLINFAAVAVLMLVFKNGSIAWHLYSYNNPLVFASSMAFFMIFVNAKPITNKKASAFLSFVAGHTFAVYLLHSNNPLLPRWRAFLINLFGQNLLYAKLLVLLPNAVIIMAIGVLIDTVYDLILKKPFAKVGVAIEKGILFLYLKLQILLKFIFGKKEIKDD